MVPAKSPWLTNLDRAFLTSAIRREPDRSKGFERMIGIFLRWGFALGVALATLEIASCALLMAGGQGLPYRAGRAAAAAVEMSAAKAERDQLDVPVLAIHPYLGFVHNREHAVQMFGRPISPYGYFASSDPVHRRAGDELVVALTGGSVAQHIGTLGEEAFLTALGRCPTVAGRPVRLVSIAQAGYKQPQQMLALSYYLMLGAEYDVVVNLDGVNELVWYFRAANDGAFEPSFPYNWPWMVRQADQETMGTQAHELGALVRRKAALAGALGGLGLERSALGQLLWWRLAARWSVDQGNLRLAMQTATTDQLTFAQAGPRQPQPAEAGAILQEAVALWHDGSRMMAQLLEARGIRYVHLLQPNQYFPDTKKLTEHEASAFRVPTSVYAQPLEEGYSLLLAAGADLRRQGVGFVDLSRAFADHDEDLYVDDCCHFNPKGIKVLARAMAWKTCGQLLAAQKAPESTLDL
jgi:hypothetical protein